MCLLRSFVFVMKFDTVNEILVTHYGASCGDMILYCISVYDDCFSLFNLGKYMSLLYYQQKGTDFVNVLFRQIKFNYLY